MEFYNTAKKVNISELNLIETSFQINLPEYFKIHYLENNGGIPENQYIYNDEYDTFFKVKFFKPFLYESEKYSTFTIEETYKMHVLEKQTFDKKYLPFANDISNNLYCLNLDNSKIDLIFLDKEEIEILNISLDFDEFIENLEEEGDD
ncbi:SMI1/KNR4 family protein [Flavobacterium columnare]|uniref:SMI1/KNR4 family protein n=1 Tax=Flavobacterium columnare TaxID=996 RepID=UPI004034CA32